MIRFEQVSVRYGRGKPLVLADVTLTIAESELAVVAGPTGSGKTTLVGCVAGLVPHFTGGTVHGRVVVGGRDTRTHRPGDLADLVGYVGQDPAAGFVTDTVEAELAYGLECLGTPPAVMRRRVEDVLDLLDLAALRDRRLRTLSGGEQQRVSLGGALTVHPRVLVLDEPTSALDPGGAEDVLAAVHRLVHDLGVTVLMTEHRLERALQFADRLVIVDDGRVRAGDPGAMMLDAPVAPPVVELGRQLGWSPLPVTVRDARRLAGPLRASFPPPAPLIRVDHGQKQRKAGPMDVIAHDQHGSLVGQVRGLTVERGRVRAVDGVDVDLRHGEVVAVMGRNGAGKSSLLAALAGMIGHQAGDVDIDGVDPAAVPAEQAIRHVGLVPQDARLLLYANTVDDECTLADEETRAGPGATHAVLEWIAPAMIRPEVLKRHPSDLSEGQRLMLALSIVLAAEPSLVLLDEPTRGLDYGSKAALCAVLRSLAVAGHGVVVATHDVEFVAELADRVVLLADGRVVGDGTTADVLLSSPVLSPQVAKVLRPRPWLTVADVARALTGAAGGRG